jgi:hypothetical protein
MISDRTFFGRPHKIALLPYLAVFIRQQQEPVLKDLITELEAERKKRQNLEKHPAILIMRMVINIFRVKLTDGI